MAHALHWHGANVHACDDENTTPLHVACVLSGCIDTVRVLLKYGAKVDVVDVQGRTPYYLCCNDDIISLLVEHGYVARY